jgi:hypothetical protein
MNCWLCGEPIDDPPEVIGHYRAGRCSLAHRGCLQVLGELELDLRAEGAGPVPSHDLGTGPAS